MSELDVNKVTRLEVIDENGRSYTKYQISDIKFSLQDDDRTLKVFLEVKNNNSLDLTDEEIAAVIGSPIDEVYLADFRKVLSKLKEKYR
jgi:uncharacterized protein YpuA (DUF1002 family)